MADDEKKIEIGNLFCFPVEKTSSGKWVHHPKEEWYLPDKEKLWGGGEKGKIYQVCRKARGCNYVMKIIRFTSYCQGDNCPYGECAYTEFLHEVFFQTEVARLGVAPPILSSWVCTCTNPPLGVIVMPVLKETLEDVIRNPDVKRGTKEAYIQEAERIFNILNANNIYHEDSHMQNWMVNGDGRLKIVDFGLVRKFWNPVDDEKCPKTTKETYHRYDLIEIRRMKHELDKYDPKPPIQN